MEIPVGRLSAINDQDVFAYLAKVQTFEGQAPAAWMKNVVHLSGGFNDNEQISLAQNLRGLEPRIDDGTPFGAVMSRFRKHSSSVFSTAAADSVRNLIENGVTLMNFFAIGGIGLLQFGSGALVTTKADPTDPVAGFSALFMFYAVLLCLSIVIYLFSKDAPPDKSI